MAYALDFNNVEKQKFKSKTIIPSILEEFENKCYQKKFVILHLLNDLSILLRIKYFMFDLKFDNRGRAYPWASLFTYLDPLLKYFFSWGQQYSLSAQQKENILQHILEQANFCQPLDTAFIRNNKNLKLVGMLREVKKKN